MKRKHIEVLKTILKVLADRKTHSYGELERKVNTNWQTIRDHCEELSLFGVIEINKENKIKITEIGLSILRKLK
jgi:predicted transcriptional regulator